MCLSASSFAQTLKDIVNPETPVTWLGLDFSLLKVVADQDAWGDKNPREMFKIWNELMINEQTKYDVAKALSRPRVKFAVDVTMDHNSALTPDDLFVQQAMPETYGKASDVAELIKSYNFKDNSGIGVMFVAVSFDRPAQKGNWWIVFVNMETKQVVYSEKMNARSTGFGLRNYWASTVYGMLKQIGAAEFKKWKTWAAAK